jgi:hypothetical protein
MGQGYGRADDAGVITKEKAPNGEKGRGGNSKCCALGHCAKPEAVKNWQNEMGRWVSKTPRYSIILGWGFKLYIPKNQACGAVQAQTAQYLGR